MERALFYLRWDESSGSGLAKDGIDVLLTEVDSSGRVLREVGLSEGGAVVHKFPSSEFRNGARGLFDGAVIANPRSEIQPEQFEAAWEGKIHDI